MHHDGTATAGRKGIPYDWQRLLDDIHWDDIVARLIAEGCRITAPTAEIAR